MSEQTVRKSKWGKVGKVMLIFATVLLCILGAAYSLTDIGSAASSYEKNRDAAKAAGLCFTVDDAKKLFEVPGEDNGALLLADLLTGPTPIHIDTTYQIDGFTDKEVLIAWKNLEPHVPAFQRAIAKPRLIFPRTFVEPYFSHKELQRLQFVVPLLARTADIAATIGDVDLTRELLVLAANIAIHIGDEPSLTALEFRASSAMSVESKLKRLIVKHGRDPKWLKIVQVTLAILEKPYKVKQVLQFEHWGWFLGGRVLLGDTSAGSLEDFGWKEEDSRPNIYLASKVVPRFRAANLSRLHQYYAEAVNGLPVDTNDVAGIAKSMRKAYSAIDYADRSVSFSYMRFQATSHSAVAGSMEIVECIEVESARRNILRQSLAILKSGSNLSKGPPLAGNFAQDVDGRTLGLDHTKDGWVVFSVGENGTDEHGALGCDDFVVRLPK